MTLHRGHCRCEGVVILARCEPEIMVYCHCDDCRRSAGAPLIAAVSFEKEHIEWKSSDTLSRYVNGTCARLFCNACGSPVAQEHESAPSRTYFNTAFMDEPERFAPTAHSYALEQLPWLELNDTLPRHKKTVSIEAR
jgi:hypothetical protein